VAAWAPAWPPLLERVPQVDLGVGPDGYRGLPELIARAAPETDAEVAFSMGALRDVPRCGGRRSPS